MRVKVNEHIICIPPYISAQWNQVAFIEAKDQEDSSILLVLHLTDGNTVNIPNLDKTIIDVIFTEHLRHLEQLQLREKEIEKEDKGLPLMSLLQQLTKGIDIQILSPKALFSAPLFGGPIDAIFQHTSENKDQPDLPTEALEKMAEVIKGVTSNTPGLLISPEPHCNCSHCQVGRFLQEEETEITDQDLAFRSWDIVQNSDNVYLVTNPLDPKEQFHVHLGSPIGCTCGQPHCEHIKAVLYS